MYNVLVFTTTQITISELTYLTYFAIAIANFYLNCYKSTRNNIHKHITKSYATLFSRFSVKKKITNILNRRKVIMNKSYQIPQNKNISAYDNNNLHP